MGLCCATPAPSVPLVYAQPVGLTENAFVPENDPQSSPGEEKKKKKKKKKKEDNTDGQADDEPQVKTELEAEADVTPREDDHGKEEGREHPDFSGKWAMTSYAGDPDQFLTDIGLPWAVRNTAKSMGLGVGKTKSIIRHNVAANEITVASTDAGGKQTIITCKIDGIEQINTNDNGEKSYSTSIWIHGGQTIETTALDKNRKAAPKSRRYFKGPDEMHVEVISLQGSIFDQIFTRQ